MARGHPESSGLDRLCVAIATGLYLSYIPFKLSQGTRFAAVRRWTGAGFIGTAIGWALLYALPLGGAAYACVVLAAIALACGVSGRAERCLGRHDDSRIIIDETVGFWTAVAWLPREPQTLAVGFILFRFFDAVKLPPYRWLERLPGGIGIVMDDVGAGIAANLVLRGIIWLDPRLLA